MRAVLASAVPQRLKTRALRRLWTTNPVLANLDGLNDYDTDFTDAATCVENIQTLYKVGRGMVDRALEVPAGGIAVFSSLTPHRTGPYLTSETRKSYILQYAPRGAVMFPRGAPSVPASHPEWQYPVVQNGLAVEGTA